MLRTIGGVIAGYVAMRVFFFVVVSVSLLVMGADRAFAPSSYEITLLWLIVSLVLSLVAAIVAGRVCLLIARGSAAVMGLASLVLILGVLSALPVLSASNREPIVRNEDVSTVTAMTNAKQPAWIALVLPWIGLAGVMIGGRTKAGLRHA